MALPETRCVPAHDEVMVGKLDHIVDALIVWAVIDSVPDGLPILIHLEKHAASASSNRFGVAIDVIGTIRGLEYALGRLLTSFEMDSLECGVLSP